MILCCGEVLGGISLEETEEGEAGLTESTVGGWGKIGLGDMGSDRSAGRGV